MTDRVLTVNAGSTSVKLRLLDGVDTVERSLDLAAGPSGFDTTRMAGVLRAWPQPDLIAHRVVHGGRTFGGPVVITPEVRAGLTALIDLAPLHQPKSLAALDAVTAVFPDVPAVAGFDTAFHAGLPAAAATYALPVEWRERFGLRRYGFHGLAHAYGSRRGAQLLERAPDDGRFVTCHLGGGASLAAVLDGRSVDTTMGFTPLDGLVMATRSGSLDPGLVLWLQEHGGLEPGRIAVALEQESGVQALAGSADLRVVEAAADRGHAGSVLALDVYLHHLVAGIAAMTAALGGLDVLVFSGGVGEHSARVRSAVAQRLAYLGIALDAARNTAAHGDHDISAAGAAVSTVVVTAREDLELARQARSLHRLPART